MENKMRRDVVKLGILGAGAMALGSSQLSAADLTKVADLVDKSIKYKYDFVADLNNNKITCSYYGNKERYWLKGKILEVKDL